MYRSGGGGGASEKGLTTGFRGINAICDRLALVKIIRDRACEIFKKVRCHECAAVQPAVPEAAVVHQRHDVVYYMMRHVARHA